LGKSLAGALAVCFFIQSAVTAEVMIRSEESSSPMVDGSSKPRHVQRGAHRVSARRLAAEQKRLIGEAERAEAEAKAKAEQEAKAAEEAAKAAAERKQKAEAEKEAKAAAKAAAEKELKASAEKEAKAAASKKAAEHGAEARAEQAKAATGNTNKVAKEHEDSKQTRSSVEQRSSSEEHEQRSARRVELEAQELKHVEEKQSTIVAEAQGAKDQEKEATDVKKKVTIKQSKHKVTSSAVIDAAGAHIAKRTTATAAGDNVCKIFNGHQGCGELKLQTVTECEDFFVRAGDNYLENYRCSWNGTKCILGSKCSSFYSKSG